MNIFVNSEKTEFRGRTIAELSTLLNLANTTGIALALNEKVITKNDWTKTLLKENDKVLIIKATQGG